jgi:glycosyltransferase involved in cell wall biosynthesis
MKFSVLLSVYSEEKPSNLESCLVSIYNSTVWPSEVIVVKDGQLPSPLLKILSKFNSYSGFIVYGYDKPMGLGYALNFGLQKCKYEIIFRMDSDDIMLNKRFEKQLKYLADNPSVSVLGGLIQEFDDNGLKSIRVVKSKPLARKIWLFNPLNHMTVAFKKSVILKHGGYDNVLYFEDFHLWLKLRKNRVVLENISTVLVHARVGKFFLRRRLGFKYVKHEINFILKSYFAGYLSLPELILFVCLRLPTRIFGENILHFIYSFFLRTRTISFENRLIP